MRSLFFLILFASLLVACKKDPKANKDDYIKLKSTEINSEEIAAKGKILMENKCYLCHSPSSSQGSRIAPPMVAIKARYLKDAQSKEDFIKDLWAFVEQPSLEKVKLKGAAKRFGLMPYQPYAQKDIEAIASYVFDYKIEEPEWFQNHYKDKHGRTFEQNGKSAAQLAEPEQSYAQIGMSYAKSTKATLGKNLMGAIQKEGVMHALSFCNVQAMPLTDSMATKHGAIIKRVSDKNRNPNNKANAQELDYISLYKQILKNGEEPEPIVVEENKKVNFYYPIVTNGMCLKCHGTPGKEIQRDTYDKIKELYPKDKAIGYDVNDVRGMWSISFDKD